MFQTSVVGADSSPTARRAVVAAAELSRLSGGTLHIVTSWNAASGQNRDVHGGYVDPGNPAKAVLQELAGVAKDRGLEPVLHATTGLPERVVVELAAQVGADVIVVGNRGMRGRTGVLGSVPNSIAHHAPCPVLIVDTSEAG